MGYGGPPTRSSPLILPNTRSHGRSSRSSTSSSVSSASSSPSDRKKKSTTGSMKCIISIGIILPILAAVIGVVAWAVGSDAIYPKDIHSRIHGAMYHTGGGGGAGFNDPFVPQIQDRSDLDFNGKLPIGAGVPKEAVGLVKEDEVDDPVSSNLGNGVLGSNPLSSSSSGGGSKGDPLYIVHYVPQKDSKETEVVSSTPSTTTHSAEKILSKILSSSKGVSKDTPQFVVFAPLPGSNDGGSDKKPTVVEDGDEDEEEEVETPKLKKTKRKRKGSKKKPSSLRNEDDDSDDDVEGYSNPHASNHGYSQPSSNVPPPQYPQSYQGYPMQNPHNQQQYPPFQQHQYPQNQQQYAPPPPQGYPPQGYGNYDQSPSGSSNVNYPVARQSDAQYAPQDGGDQQQDSHRLGHLGIGVGVPKGVTVHVGGGKGVLPLSPLGFLKTLLLPLLPKPRVNLNQKVFFGVQLDKGIGFGGHKGHHHHHH